jgi:hypothetical protein
MPKVQKNRGKWPPHRKHFLHLETLKYAPKTTPEVIKVVIFKHKNQYHWANSILCFLKITPTWPIFRAPRWNPPKFCIIMKYRVHPKSCNWQAQHSSQFFSLQYRSLATTYFLTTKLCLWKTVTFIGKNPSNGFSWYTIYIYILKHFS